MKKLSRAQVRYSGKKPLKNQAEANALFAKWQTGDVPSETFRVLVFGKRRRLTSVQRQRLHLGKMGRIKLYADPQTSLIDHDSMRAPTLSRVFKVSRILGITPVYVRMDRSHSGRWHVIVRWREKFSRFEMVAIQSMLGSDWKREAFNLFRARSGTKSKRWNFLFESKLE